MSLSVQNEIRYEALLPLETLVDDGQRAQSAPHEHHFPHHCSCLCGLEFVCVNWWVNDLNGSKCLTAIQKTKQRKSYALTRSAGRFGRSLWWLALALLGAWCSCMSRWVISCSQHWVPQFKCRVYVDLIKRLRNENRVIYVQSLQTDTDQTQDVWQLYLMSLPGFLKMILLQFTHTFDIGPWPVEYLSYISRLKLPLISSLDHTYTQTCFKTNIKSTLSLFSRLIYPNFSSFALFIVFYFLLPRTHIFNTILCNYSSWVII